MLHPPHSTGKRVRGVISTASFEPFKLNIRRLITSAGGPLTKGNSNAEEARKPACADSVCIKDGQRRQRAVPFHPKAALASCLAMILSADNGTPVQPQRNVMGAARRDPRRGARPVRGASRRSAAALAPGRSVEKEQASKFQKQGRLCVLQSRPVDQSIGKHGINLRFPML